MRQYLTEVLSGERAAQDARIVEALRRLIREQSAEHLVAYMPIRQEIDVRGLLREALAMGRTVWLPRFDSSTGLYELGAIRDIDTDTRAGHYGIQEPAFFSDDAFTPLHHSFPKALWIIPGIAFDLSGNRLGRGGGFYDRMLEDADGVKVGVAYDCQIVEAVPSEPNDVKMTYVVTEERICHCSV